MMSEEPQKKIIKVAASSRINAVAGAIAGVLREHGFVEVQAIGASAVNRAIKAIVLAQRYLTSEGKKLCFYPRFIDTLIKGQERTVLQFMIESLSHSSAHASTD